MKDFRSYKNPALAIDLIVFGYNKAELTVLLLNRKEEPFKNCWTLPGAFLKIDETFEAVCERILFSKLGINKIYLEQLYTFDDPERDNRGRVISVAYYALVNPEKFKVTAGHMANDFAWYRINELPKLGFDHTKIFHTALQRLQAKIMNFPIGFELLDELFTMTELHDLYERILGSNIDRRNFRRKILASGYIINSGTKREGLQNRPADLYKFNKALKQNSFQLNTD